MGYALGIDLGTTFSSAAIVDNSGRAEIVSLGYRAPTIPSIVALREDGELLIGEIAERRATIDPLRSAREFKRRLGDPTPLLLGGSPFSAESLMAALLRGIYAIVTEQRGETPDTLIISHPANFGPYKIDLMEQVVRMAEVGEAKFTTEPIAAALHYAGRERIEPGEIVAVYDFGGGTFDAALLRRTTEGFESEGRPEGIERLGGIDFDEAIFRHVVSSLDGAMGELDPNDSAALSAVVRLRDECREAKEALSIDTDVIIPVVLPNLQTEVRLTRGEFEDMVSPRIGETIAALRRSARSADLELNQVDKILLVGGSSRIPLVRQQVREVTGARVELDAHPKHAISLGAAIAAELARDERQSPRPTPIVEEPEAVPVVEPVVEPVAATPPPRVGTQLVPEPAVPEPEVQEAPAPEPPAPEPDFEIEDIEYDPEPAPPPVHDPVAPTEPAQRVVAAPVDREEETHQVSIFPQSRPTPARYDVDVASNRWLDGIQLSPAIIAGLVATLAISALATFMLLRLLVG